ncbi:hypothetical protein [Paraburkholderia sp. J94]|uniref:hypothetical protein n=1 Tax=Paraburkholderia sp. J94 TaxID=2805441 RepID=UPI002AAFC7F1|nr:hypothetical protein [Paraburkholderia sp. J94]
MPAHRVNLRQFIRTPQIGRRFRSGLKTSMLATAAVALTAVTGCTAVQIPLIYINGPRAVTHYVCIDLNTKVADDRFLPSLRQALQNRGVVSEVYSPGSAPGVCETRLLYNVVVEYANKSGTNNPAIYWSIINLDTMQYGRIVATAHYHEAPVKNRMLQTGILSQMVDRVVSAP